MAHAPEPPDPARAVARYREHAAGYDASARRTMRIRSRTVARLDLRPGDCVLDVACGTGLSLPALRDAVGPTGRVIGVELSPDMLALARPRVADSGWRNVELIESSMQSTDIRAPVDAVLLHFTHDVLRSPAALTRIFAAARPGARIACAGLKYAPWWMAPANLLVRAKARPYATTLDGLATPWDLMLPHLAAFDWQRVLFGIGYIGWGRTHDGER